MLSYQGLRSLFTLPFIDLLSPIPQPAQLPFSKLVPTSPKQPASFESSCPSPGLSCPGSLPSPLDPCCLNYPGGHFLATQFWDTDPPLGPNNSWTIHGLWPDYCSGGFDAYCDSERSLSEDELEDILSAAAETTHPDLLDYMKKYWLSFHARDSNLWTHEWNKHGTCISTIEPQCYSEDYDKQAPKHRDLLDYFTHATHLFSKLNTFVLLAQFDITPSWSKTYTLDEISHAIESSSHGFPATVRCNAHHELQEVWYHFNVRGSLRNASIAYDSASDTSTWVPTNPDGQISNCPQSGIKYIPKRSSHSPTQTSPGSQPTSTTPSTPFKGKGNLKVHVLSESPSRSQTPNSVAGQDSYVGCLIRSGVWYSSGTCARYTAKPDVVDPGHSSLFSLESSFAPCAILLEDNHKYGRRGEFVCARHLPVESIFGTADDGKRLGDSAGHRHSVLSYRNQSVFWADKVPGRFEKVSIFADDGDGSRVVQVEIHWETL